MRFLRCLHDVLHELHGQILQLLPDFVAFIHVRKSTAAVGVVQQRASLQAYLFETILL